MKLRPRALPARRVVPAPQIIRVERATFIPTGMHGVQEEQRMNEGWRTATLIPTGMHATIIVDKRRVLESVVEGLVARGVDAVRARVLVDRAAVRQYRNRGNGLGSLGDVVSDAMTWVTYGNGIIEQSKTSNVVDEARRAALNISTFLGNRGDELQAASSDTVDALGEMSDKLSRIYSGKIKYDSVAGSFFDEFGNAIRGEVIVGAKAVYNAPKRIVKYAVDEVIKPALDVVPWYVWAGAAAAGVAVGAKALHLW
jgi:hypothetical protein